MVGWAHQEHRDRQIAEHPFGYAAEQQMAQPGLSVCRHRHNINVSAPREIGDLLGWLTKAHQAGHAIAITLEQLLLGQQCHIERGLFVGLQLAIIDRVERIIQIALALVHLARPVVRDWPWRRADDANRQLAHP